MKWERRVLMAALRAARTDLANALDAQKEREAQGSASPEIAARIAKLRKEVARLNQAAQQPE